MQLYSSKKKQFQSPRISRLFTSIFDVLYLENYSTKPNKLRVANNIMRKKMIYVTSHTFSTAIKTRSSDKNWNSIIVPPTIIRALAFVFHISETNCCSSNPRVFCLRGCRASRNRESRYLGSLVATLTNCNAISCVLHEAKQMTTTMTMTASDYTDTHAIHAIAVTIQVFVYSKRNHPNAIGSIEYFNFINNIVLGSLCRKTNCALRGLKRNSPVVRFLGIKLRIFR